MSSILTSVKKMLGITEDYTVFDPDIIIHINSVFSILHQLGIGPENGFQIADKASNWEDYLQDDNTLNMAQSYMYFKVRLMFDPPQAGPLIEAMNRQISELEWRMRVAADPSDE